MKLKDVVVGFPWVLHGHTAHSEPVRLELESRGIKTLKYNAFTDWKRGNKPVDSVMASISKTHITVENYHIISEILHPYLPKPLIHLTHGASIWKHGVHVKAIDYNLSPSILWNEHYKYLEGNRVKETYLDTGLPKLDGLVKKIPNRRVIREEYIKELKLDPSKPIIAFLPTWYSESASNGVGTLLELSRIDFNSISNFIVAPHTSDYNTDHKKAMAIVDSSKYKCLDVNKDSLLLSADIIVGDISSMLIESLVVDRPIIHIHKNNYMDFCICRRPELGLLLLGSLVSMPGLKNSIEANLKQDLYKGLRDFWKDRLLYKADGKSAHRAAENIIKIIKETLVNE